MQNTVVVSEYSQMDRILREERKYILDLCKAIQKTGCNVLLVQKSILRDAVNDLSLHFLAKMKILTQGRWLWTRTIGSTLVGEMVDSSLFYFIAFYGIWATPDIIAVATAQYFLKTGWEVVMTPVTYKIVGALKRVENEDYYDHNTNFTPFKIT